MESIDSDATNRLADLTEVIPLGLVEINEFDKKKCLSSLDIEIPLLKAMMTTKGTYDYWFCTPSSKLKGLPPYTRLITPDSLKIKDIDKILKFRLKNLFLTGISVQNGIKLLKELLKRY